MSFDFKSATTGLVRAAGIAVPLVRAEAPFVGTGIEERVARDSKIVVVADDAGPGHIVVRGDRPARSRYAVITQSHAAMREQAINQRLSRAVESIRSVIDPYGHAV